ncbi:MAG TPA: imidazole glycerol phosphate synthase subunit HisH, partial [Polyangiaceae bacterium]|nr:imidazole glycerol phosphate synthase subunit HisH [Polyangiaceae bacterium]
MRVAVLDTGHANLTSVCRALEEAGKPLNLTVLRTHDTKELARADKLVVPGQGGFGDCLRGIEDQKEVLRERVQAGVPYLGICLGLQALFDSSEEAPGVPGLGWFAGDNVRLGPAPGIKIPHMGWNSLDLTHGGHPVLDAAGGAGSWVYFVHSYHAQPTDPTLVKATVQHGPHT